MPSINLAPGTQQIAAAQRRRRRLYLLTIVVLLLTGAAWGGLLFYQQQLNSEAETVQQQLRNVQAETARLADQADRVKIFESRLTAIDALLNRHVNWDPVLTALEQLVPTTVAFTRFSATASTGEVQLNGSTSDIDQVAQTLASFLERPQSSVFTKGVFGGIDRKETGTPEEGIAVEYDFLINLTFNPKILTGAQ